MRNLLERLFEAYRAGCAWGNRAGGVSQPAGPVRQNQRNG
jgi:hypothetical protein